MTSFETLIASPDYINRREPVLVPLEWLMKNAIRSVDTFKLNTFEGWQRMMRKKCSDSGFGHLVESIMERGFLPEGAIGFCEGEITEGHHRLCAAILLCLDEVWVSPWGSDIPHPTKQWHNLVSAHDVWDTNLPVYGIDIIL